MPTLTVSGNEITDATRAAGVQGDGRSAEGSFGIWEATTNLMPNGGFESNTTGWTTAGTNTIATSTEQAKFGSRSCKFTYGDNNLGAQHSITLTAAAHTMSAWVYVPASYDGTVISVRFSGFTSATGDPGFNNVNLGLRDQWQRVIIGPYTPDAGDLSGLIQWVVSTGAPTAGKFFYIDGIQVEAQPIATPYVETDGGTAARSAARVQAPVSLIDETQAWIAIRARANNDYDDAPLGFPIVWGWYDDESNNFQGYYAEGSNFWLQSASGGTTDTIHQPTTFSQDDVITLVYHWTSSDCLISLNGSTFNSEGDHDNIPTLSATTWDIGTRGDSAVSHCNFDVFWFATGTGTLTDADAAAIAAYGN